MRKFGAHPKMITTWSHAIESHADAKEHMSSDRDCEQITNNLFIGQCPTVELADFSTARRPRPQVFTPKSDNDRNDTAATPLPRLPSRVPATKRAMLPRRCPPCNLPPLSGNVVPMCPSGLKTYWLLWHSCMKKSMSLMVPIKAASAFKADRGRTKWVKITEKSSTAAFPIGPPIASTTLREGWEIRHCAVTLTLD